jgi:[acyl-carrier-protein] S-malonyltransferase
MHITDGAGKTAFLFPGQGSQFAGMGKALCESYRDARVVFQEADDTLGFSISRLCFEGPEDSLKLTENTQPALLTVSVAAFCALQSKGLQPDYVAGHSLGEYSALVAAGALKFADALRLVRKRGKFMQQAVPPGVGAMAALLRLPESKLEPVLEQAARGEVVTPANFNSPDQVVIAGHTGAIERALELAKTAGAKRAIRLPVSAPFHCPLMEPAKESMRPELANTEFADLHPPLINNWQAAEIRSAEDARYGLLEQIPGPVLWTQSIRRLAGLGVTRCVEVGAGGVLTGLLKSIDPKVTGMKFGEPADWQKVRQEFKH